MISLYSGVDCTPLLCYNKLLKVCNQFKNWGGRIAKGLFTKKERQACYVIQQIQFFVSPLK